MTGREQNGEFPFSTVIYFQEQRLVQIDERTDMAFMKTIVTDCPFTFSFPEGFLEQWESEHPNVIPFSIELPPQQPEEQPDPDPGPEVPPIKRETEIVELPASGGQSDSDWEPNEEDEEEDDEEYEYPKQIKRKEEGGAKKKKRRKRPQPYRKRETRRNKRRRMQSKTQNKSKKRAHSKTTCESLDSTLSSLHSFFSDMDLL